MEIKEIKQQLSLLEVVAHYGLHPDAHYRLRCPFHADKTPSLQLYPKTGTYCCFSSNCNAGTGDAIQFIQLMEKCNKHEALIKAEGLLPTAGVTLPVKPVTAPAVNTEVEVLEQEALLLKVFNFYKKALPLTKKAVEYLEGRGITYPLHEIGYNSGGLHVESKNHYLVSSMVKYGLLKSRPAGGYNVWAKDCVIFPLRNRDNKIVSFYGRSISNDTDQRHFYLVGRSGLYPGYPQGSATRLVLTESMIDAASLLQQPEISMEYSVLALYGTNGLTEEHQQAIMSCKKSSVVIPAVGVSAPSDNRLNTANAELLIYDGGLLQLTVLGGIKVMGLDRMRVTLKVAHLQKQLLPLRHNLDLYNHGHTEQLISKIAELFDMSMQVVAGVIGQLTSALEGYRVQRMESLQPKAAVRPELTAAQRQAAINYLQQENLLQQTNADIGKSGIVGEAVNRLIAYLVYSSRKQATPLHVMFLGASASGKTYLQEKVSSLIPVEDKIEITQITENAFYYFKQEELKHKLLLIEDLDGAESSLYPLRELQSKKRISKTVTLKDSKGNLKTVTVKVEGPVSVSGCTTRKVV